MSALLLSRTTVIWLLMIGATLLSWEMGHGIGIPDPQLAGAAIIVVTFIKARFVIFDFMELRGAPKWMRFLADGWLVAISALLIARFTIV